MISAPAADYRPFLYFYHMAGLVFFNSVRFWGGGEKLHLELALGCRDLGHAVTLACDRRGELWKRAQAARLNCVDVRVRNLSFVNPFSRRRLTQLFRTLSPDAVIFTTSQDVKAGASAARMAGVPHVVYLRGLAAPVKNNRINRTLFTSTLTHIIANSEETQRNMLRSMQQVKGVLPVQVVYHGIHLQENTTVTVHPVIAEKGRGIILGNAGRLTAQKGQADLIQLAAKLRDRQVNFTLFIAGEGEERKTLQRAITALHLNEQVFLLGFVEDMAAFMHSLDIFLLSSHWEGFGFVLAEAMAYRKPVVAYASSSNPEIIQQEETGLLVPPHNITAFADAVEQLANDITLRHRMGEAGRKRVERHFAFNTQTQALLDAIFSKQAYHR